MSAVRIIVIFCLHVVHTEAAGVVKRTKGEDVTIQCRCGEKPEYMSLNMGLNREKTILFKEKINVGNHELAKNYSGRVQLNVNFPNVDILIRNLTVMDTGVYWCDYTKYSPTKGSRESVKSSGSVLLVVSDESKVPTQLEKTCSESGSMKTDMVLLVVVVVAAVLVGVIMGILVWIFKNKHSSGSTVKPRHVPSNDVYEDMRGTLRR